MKNKKTHFRAGNFVTINPDSDYADIVPVTEFGIVSSVSDDLIEVKWNGGNFPLFHFIEDNDLIFVNKGFC